MGVLLGLGGAELLPALLRHQFAQDAGEVLGRVGHGDVGGQLDVVLGEGHQLHLRPVGLGEGLEAGMHEGVAELPGPVGPEVEEDDPVPILDGLEIGQPGGAHELVRLAAGVGGVDALQGARGLVLGHAVHEHPPGPLHALPALVAVHDHVAPAEASELHQGQIADLEFQPLKEAVGALLLRVAAVQVGVDDRRHALVLGPLGEGDEVVLVAVDAAGAHQPHEVQALAGGLEVGEKGRHRLVLPEGPLPDGGVDAGELLPDHAPGPEVHVAHLRVPELALGQAHRLAPGEQLGGGVAPAQVVEGRHPRDEGGVEGVPGPVAEAVQDEQSDGTWDHVSPFRRMLRALGRFLPGCRKRCKFPKL